MKLNSQTRIIVGTAAALAAVDIAVRLIPMNHNPIIAPSGGVVVAREFHLVDQYGNDRALISLDGNGDPGIRLIDRTGTVRAQLDTFDATPSLILCDPNGQRRTYFGMDNDSGNGVLDLYNNEGQSLAGIHLDGNAGHFTSSDANGATQIIGSGETISIR
jgi:hypothetical protein